MSFALTAVAGDLWYASAPVNHNSKAFADGAGWLPQVTPSRLLFLASYPDTQPGAAAPGGAEIEIFTNGDYVEIEAQGPLTAIAPGDALTWTVRWKLRLVLDEIRRETSSLRESVRTWSWVRRPRWGQRRSWLASPRT